MSSTIYRRPCPAPDAQCQRYGTFLVGALGKAPSIIWVVLSCISNYSCIVPFNQGNHQMVYTMNAEEEHKKDLNSNGWQGRKNHLSRKWARLGPCDVFIQSAAFSQRRGFWVIVPHLKS